MKEDLEEMNKIKLESIKILANLESFGNMV